MVMEALAMDRADREVAHEEEDGSRLRRDDCHGEDGRATEEEDGGGGGSLVNGMAYSGKRRGGFRARGDMERGEDGMVALMGMPASVMVMGETTVDRAVIGEDGDRRCLRWAERRWPARSLGGMIGDEEDGWCWCGGQRAALVLVEEGGEDDKQLEKGHRPWQIKHRFRQAERWTVVDLVMAWSARHGDGGSHGKGLLRRTMTPYGWCPWRIRPVSLAGVAVDGGMAAGGGISGGGGDG